MDSYWDLYVAYVNHCVEYNKKHDIDPHHYHMEWNHFLPKCIFGDQPIGHYLLLKQHAIATALQTLAFKKCCLCGWHKEHLPGILLELAWPYLSRRSSETLKETHKRYNIGGKSQLGVENGRANAKKSHAEKDEFGRSVHGVKAAEKLNEEKNEEGKSVNAVKGAKKLNEILHAEKDENGKSVFAMKTLGKTHEEKDEQGRSAHAMRVIKKIHETFVGEKRSEANKKRAKTLGKEKLQEFAAKMNSQRWVSTVDGFESTARGVVEHNKSRGWDPNDRVRVS